MTQIQTLFLYAGFNNYYNRQVKRFDYLDEYGDPVATISGMNFQFNDGVIAEIVCNLANHLYSDEPDYVVARDDSTYSLSRWFIMDIKRERNGQSKMTLRRDVVADFYNAVLDAPCFIEKATLGLNNNLIFNSEAMTYNQIKQGEYPLTDRTGCPWIVGYIPRNVPNNGGENPQPTDKTITGPSNTLRVDGEFESWEDYEYGEYIGNFPGHKYFQGEFSDLTFGASVEYLDYSAVLGFDSNGNAKTASTSEWKPMTYPREGLTYVSYGTSGGWKQQGYISGMREKQDKFLAKARTYDNWEEIAYNYCDAHNKLETTAFLQEQGKIYKVGDTYFQPTVKNLGPLSTPYWIHDISVGSELGSQMKLCAEEAGFNTQTISSVGAPCNFLYTANDYVLVMEEITSDTVSVVIKADRVHLTDAPYDMFCIPYGYFKVHWSGYGREYEAPTEMMSIASAIATTLGPGTGLYDLQLLPYCPLNQQVINDEGVIDMTLLDEKAYVEIFDAGEIPLGLLFWCDKSNFTTQLIDPELPALPTDSVEFKVKHETEFYRMVSPNYNGTFEIKQTSNRGLSGFTATCSYKPFTPYIKVAPTFSGLYGGSYGDARGLICGGDFSLPVMSDAWENYQIQNKNYQVMFDRQIENMEFNNNIAIAQGITSAITGAGSAGVQGYMMGSLGKGNLGPVGAGITGAISAAAGVADVALLASQQRETLDYTKDNFGYQLGNIKALPQSLTKVSSFNADNKTFPFLEFYTCSEVEKETLRKKLKYNGMTTMAVGTIREYLQPQESYIKGQLIRLENEGMDYHILLELATEINKGVFIV